MADKLCNLAMDNEGDFKFMSDLYSEYQLIPGVLVQCHSDGGMRGCGIAASAFALTVLRNDDDGTLVRKLLVAEAVFISDTNISSFKAERIALTMAMKAMHAFVNECTDKRLNA